MQVDADSFTLAPGKSGVIQLGPFEGDTRLYVAATGVSPGLVRVTRFEGSGSGPSSTTDTLVGFGDDNEHVIPAGATVVLEVLNDSAQATTINAGLWTIAR
jgi:hypothetical protein